jgi:hypothetical protein
LRALAHHAQQEQRRLEALVGSLSILNPKQLDHLRRLQPNFNFKERLVTERIYQSTDEKSEEQIQSEQTSLFPSSMVVKSLCNSPLDMRSLTDHTYVDMCSITGENPIVEEKNVPPSKERPQTSGSTLPEQDVSLPTNYGISQEEAMLLDRVKWFLHNFGETTFSSMEQVSHDATATSSTDHLYRGAHNEDKLELSVLNSSNYVSLTMPTSETDKPPVIEVIMNSPQEEDSREYKETFVSAVTAATAATLKAISHTHVTANSILATNLFGNGFENISSRMLVGILNFLQHGDTSIFAEEDKMSWSKHILQGALHDSIDEVGSSSSSSLSRMDEIGKLSDVTIIGNMVKSVVDRTEAKDSTSNHNKKQLWNNNVDIPTESVLANDFTWRAALIGLRTLHPNPNQYYSLPEVASQAANLKGSASNPDTTRVAQSNLPLRLIHLKERMTQIMQDQENKHLRRLSVLGLDTDKPIEHD